MKIYAIIPARSGSQGLTNKNILPIAGKPLLSYSIDFAKKLNVDRIFCSTDSKQYADIAIEYGAEVPFLRSAEASASNSMEQDVLKDLYSKFESYGIEQPDLIVWLRPTFVFRNLGDVKKCISMLLEDKLLSSARTVCEAESRLYKVRDNVLTPDFMDNNKSMIRRQDVGERFKVFSTDVIRADKKCIDDDFLGQNVAAVITNKFCGFDIDDEVDFKIVESIIVNNSDLIKEYT
jgi:CMP-N,N'-diacetyllegionaminic acid synthase